MEDLPCFSIGLDNRDKATLVNFALLMQPLTDKGVGVRFKCPAGSQVALE